MERRNQQERLKEQLLSEALRRSENIFQRELDYEKTHQGISGVMMTEEEAIEEAIRNSIHENNN